MKQKGVDTATPVLTETTATPGNRVSATHTHVTAAKGSSDWANLPTTVQTSFDEWAKSADDMAQNQSDIDDLLKEVESKRVAERVLLAAWMTQRQICLVGVKKYCAGSKTKVKNLGFGVAGRAVRPPAADPSKLIGRRAKVAGGVNVEWACDAYRHTYELQWATDIANAATYSEPMTVSKRSVLLLGQTPGATLHVRVRVLDAKLPAGRSAWTLWAAVQVS